MSTLDLLDKRLTTEPNLSTALEGQDHHPVDDTEINHSLYLRNNNSTPNQSLNSTNYKHFKVKWVLSLAIPI